MQLQQRTIMQLILYPRQKCKFDLLFILIRPNKLGNFGQVRTSRSLYLVVRGSLTPPILSVHSKSKFPNSNNLFLFSRFQLVAQHQHAMSIMRSLMHGVSMVHTILVKITEIINQSNSVMFLKSKFQQNIGQEKDSQL